MEYQVIILLINRQLILTLYTAINQSVFIFIASTSTVGATVIAIIIIVTAASITFYWMKKKRSKQYEAGARGKKGSSY